MIRWALLQHKRRLLVMMRKLVRPNLLCPHCNGRMIKDHHRLLRVCDLCYSTMREEDIYRSLSTMGGCFRLITLGTTERSIAQGEAAQWGCGGEFVPNVSPWRWDGKMWVR